MRLKFTLEGARRALDLVAVVDSTVTVGELAERIAQSAPEGAVPGAAAPHTLELLGAGRAALPADVAIADSAIRSGVSLALRRADGAERGESAPAARAVVTIVSGAEAGSEFTVGAGTAYIGRDPSCEIRIDDPLVSRKHARLIVSDVVEIIDLGSANGIAIDGSLVSRAVLRPGDVVEVGEAEITVRLVGPVRSAEDGQVDFNRSPRLAPRFKGVEFDVPEAPSRPQRRRIPMLPLLAPILMGALLYAVTKTTTSLIFVALSPVMLLGNALEAIIFGRRDYRAELEAYRADLQALASEATATREVERAARLEEHPSTEVLLAAAHDQSPLLWTRRPEHDEFLSLRLGLGVQTSRNTFDLNVNRQAARDVVGEARALVASYATVDGVPVAERLSDVGAVGVAGTRESALGTARALVAQLVTLHSPAEVVVAACVSSNTVSDWDWLKWIPHTSSPQSPLGEVHLASSAGDTRRLIADLEELVASRSGVDAPSGPQLPAVVVLVDDPSADWGRLVAVAERGQVAGLSFVFVARSVEQLPAVCRTYVDVGGSERPTVAGFVREGAAIEPLEVERVESEAVKGLGRQLCATQDAAAPVEDESDLPALANLLTLLKLDDTLHPEELIERWQASNSLFGGPHGREPKRRAGALRAVVGQGASDPITLDLRTDGPHALVGGTTGSGKSEFLQAWILSLAATYSPQRLTFLLVDYKGGSAFRACSELPHTVGLVTDLTPHLVQRTLTSLEAELEYREHLLALKRAKDVAELEKAGDPEAPPSLVIVVDEFAALVQEVPEFVDGVVNVAQRGRSLGLHLILATQRPAGVIKGNLRANTNLRVALRVADEGDSIDVIDSPVAAAFSADTPGRAVVKTGPGRLTPFQSAYAGGSTAGGPPPPQISLFELPFGRGAEWFPPEEHEDTLREPPPADISRLVEAVRAAAAAAEIPVPRRPWLDELNATYDLSTLLAKSDRELVFGYLDDPEHQDQRPVAFNPDTDGNLVVYGTGGSGKSTLLRTLAVAASVTRRGGPCWVYGLDFGSRGLHMLEQLPHVGAIVDGEDHERISRLLRMLRQTIDERAVRYAAAGAGTLTQFRERAGASDEPRLLILLDGVAAFRQAYEIGERSRWYEMLVGIAADGRGVGVHLAISADRTASIPSALGSSIQRRIVLRMADEMEYSLLGLPNDVLTLRSPPGRGLYDEHEVQVAVLGGSTEVFAQAEATRDLAESMGRAGVVAAPGIERLAEEIPSEALPATVGERPTLGMESDQLVPVGFAPAGSFLVAGPPGSGRTTALLTLAQSLRRWDKAVRTVYFGNARSPLAGLDLWDDAAATPDDAATLAATLESELFGSQNGRPVAIFVEAVPDFINTAADLPLQGLLKRALDHGALVVGEGETSALSGSYPLQQLVKSHRTGVVLQPDQVDGMTLFRTGFPRSTRGEFPPGRGFFVSRGQAQVVQLPLPE